MESAKKNIYVFRPYRKIFTRYFSLEKRKLQSLLPYAKIEHIGSTAVPGLGGKGIVDVIVSVPKARMRSVFRKLARVYTFDKGGGSDERYFFTRNIVSNRKIRSVHLHLTDHGNKEWLEALAFRDALRKSPVLQKAYATLKRKACAAAKGNGLIYRHYKNPFIREVLKTFS